jgi:hypothetical protein
MSKHIHDSIWGFDNVTSVMSNHYQRQYLGGLVDMPILYFDLTRSGLESTLYHTRRGHANYYTTDAVQVFTEAPGDIHYNQYI